VLAERPKLAPHLHAMKASLSQVLELNPSRLSIKATTNEGLGFLGREEGIAALAIVSLDLPQ
jgi:2-C-methyl-D-erythritol 2,4-cyclodiphosphate synthase